MSEQRTRMWTQIEYATPPEDAIYFKCVSFGDLKTSCARRDTQGRCTTRPLFRHDNPPCRPGTEGCDPAIFIDRRAPNRQETEVAIEYEVDGDDSFNDQGY